MTDERKVLERVLDEAIGFLEDLDGRPVAARTDVDGVAAALGQPLPEDGLDPMAVVEELITGAEPGVVAMPSGRFYGWVIGGVLPAALAADWLTSTWDQNAGLLVSSPAAAGVERVAGRWLLELLGLPSTAAVGFVTGAMMANFTCLAAARHEVLRRVGWDGEADGLLGAPPVTVVVGEERHESIDLALRYLGLGPRRSVVVPADAQGRLRPDALAAALDRRQPGPAIVCLQAGNVHSGAFETARCGDRGRPRPPRLGARRRCLRPLGGRVAGAPSAHRRGGPGRLLGHRRTQDAQRPLRQWAGDRG